MYSIIKIINKILSSLKRILYISKRNISSIRKHGTEFFLFLYNSVSKNMVITVIKLVVIWEALNHLRHGGCNFVLEKLTFCILYFMFLL